MDRRKHLIELRRRRLAGLINGVSRVLDIGATQRHDPRVYSSYLRACEASIATDFSALAADFAAACEEMERELSKHEHDKADNEDCEDVAQVERVSVA